MNSLIGKKIRNLREQKGFTQEELAERLNISRSTYQRIEKGDTNTWADYLKNLCTELEVQPEDIVSSDSVFSNNSIKQKGDGTVGLLQNTGTLNLYPENIAQQIEQLLNANNEKANRIEILEEENALLRKKLSSLQK